MKKVVSILLPGGSPLVSGQRKPKIPVLVVGSFHFAYPSQDVLNVRKKNQLNVLKKQRQAETEKLVTKLSRYNPTKVAVELKTWQQQKVDSQNKMRSLYN